MPFLSSISFKAENRTVAPETILNYLKACEEAYLLYRFKSQDINGKKVLKVNEKYYVADHGLREAVIGSNLQNVEIVLENIVGLELLRRGYKIYVGRMGTREIDFVGEKQGGFQIVQDRFGGYGAVLRLEELGDAGGGKAPSYVGQGIGNDALQ